ncbi:MAG: phospho-N-acetylmuramoyl-pentapeptide-transferase, partial [Chlamydiae bacterium CG10_big_fil_rev_8_21_14_0_10_35_9]
TVVLGMIGAVDDYYKLRYKNSKGIKPKKKLLFQVLFSTLVSLYLLAPSFQSFIEKTTSLKPPIAKTFSEKRVTTLSTTKYSSMLYMPFMKQPLLEFKGALLFILWLFLILVITGTSNAVNLTDGLDGLAAGCIIMVAITLAIFAFLSNHMELSRYLNILYIEGSGEIAVYLLALSGAALGFLWFNGYPAQVFMGDTGSLGLGGILGLSAILIKRELILALAGMIFVVETLSVILQVLSYKFRNKKRIFLCSPLHHHFEYKGWPETKVVLRFWIISLLFCIIAIASLKFQ